MSMDAQSPSFFIQPGVRPLGAQNLLVATISPLKRQGYPQEVLCGSLNHYS